LTDVNLQADSACEPIRELMVIVSSRDQMEYIASINNPWVMIFLQVQ